MDNLKKVYDTILPLAVLGLFGFLWDANSNIAELKREMLDIRAEKELIFNIITEMTEKASEAKKAELIMGQDKIFRLLEHERTATLQLEDHKFELMLRLIDQ